MPALLSRPSIWLLLLLLWTACAPSLPFPTRPTASPLPTTTPTALPPPTATPRSPLGAEDNPLVLALPPSRFPAAEQIGHARKLAALLSERSGYRFLAVAPFSYPDLIQALQKGNVHLAALPPFALVKAYQHDAVRAFYASTRQGTASYGAQFIGPSDRFTAYFDPLRQQNTASAPVALEQLRDQKPCWTNPASPAGYLIPFGLLNWYRIPTQEGAFVQSHFDVVRALRLGGICDFGATYVDARLYPPLRESHPFLLDEVIVIWQIPPIIPYDGLFLSAMVPADVAAELQKTIYLLLPLPEGKQVFQALYSMEDLIPVDDLFYVEFRRYLEASGADLDALIATLESRPDR